MIAFVVFLCVVFVIWGFLGYHAAYWKGYDHASEGHWPEACDAQLDEQWGWLVKANARRKRFERALKKERALSKFLAHHNLNLLADIRHCLAELHKQESLARSLAAELLNEVVVAEDRETVTRGLTRKL